jgi:hypothetical protein
MITNDMQYRVTKAHLQQFEEALANLKAASGTKSAKLRKLEIDAVHAKIDDFRAEIYEYERLCRARSPRLRPRRWPGSPCFW